MPGDVYVGREPYVDPGTEPVDHTNEAEAETEAVEEVEVEETEAELDEKAGEVEDEAKNEPVIPADIAQKAAFFDYVQTQEGALDYLIEAGLGLGKSMDDLEAFFLGKVEDDPEPDEDDDRVMTVAEWKAEQAKLRGELNERDLERERQAQVAVVNQRASASLKALRIGEDPLSEKQLQVVANFADQRLDEDDYLDPDAVEAAIVKGFADFTEAMGFSAEGKKVVKRKVVPKGLKGATGGAEAVPEPQNLEDAFKRARAQLKAAGELA